MYPNKNYIVDTNVLLEDPECLLKLRNGNENTVYIPYHVLLELNRLKKHLRFGKIVSQVIQTLTHNPEKYRILQFNRIADVFSGLVDNHILDEIKESGLENPILVTNDKIMGLRAGLRNISNENYETSVHHKIDADTYTGFMPSKVNYSVNSFYWNEYGKPVFRGIDGDREIDYQHCVWNVRPRSVYQNLALDLMLNPDLHLISVQSAAGYGKSFLALAAALYMSLELKQYSKIFVVKPMVEIGQRLGYLPGCVNEKMKPYTRYMCDLLLKLHHFRPANRIFTNPDMNSPQFDIRRFEILPLTYIRGMNIENAVVVVDEVQNMSRTECRALLSRMGEGVKVICLGDIHQVDHPHLNQESNGLNWIVKKFRGEKIYAHMVLKGERSRGPITDMVIRTHF
ncbi:MAG: PhoH family protein [Desulfobacterales bacterium]